MVLLELDPVKDFGVRPSVLHEQISGGLRDRTTFASRVCARESQIEGTGAFAVRRIPRGTFVCDYHGHLMVRGEECPPKSRGYLFGLNEQVLHLLLSFGTSFIHTPAFFYTLVPD
jgi:hypothetical protein